MSLLRTGRYTQLLDYALLSLLLLIPAFPLVFLILANFLCYATAVLIYGIVQNLLPDSSTIATVAALLFIVNPTEPTRFYVFSSQAFVCSDCYNVRTTEMPTLTV